MVCLLVWHVRFSVNGLATNMSLFVFATPNVAKGAPISVCLMTACKNLILPVFTSLCPSRAPVIV